MFLELINKNNPNINKSIKRYLKHPLFIYIIVNVFYDHWKKLKKFEDVYKDIIQDNELLREFLYLLKLNTEESNKSIEEKVYLKNTVADIFTYLENSFDISEVYWPQKIKNDINEKVYRIIWNQNTSNPTIQLFKAWVPFKIENKIELEKYKHIETIEIFSIIRWIDLVWYPKAIFKVNSSLWEILVTQDWEVIYHTWIQEIISDMHNIEVAWYWTIIKTSFLWWNYLLQDIEYKNIFTDDNRQIVWFNQTINYKWWATIIEVVLNDWNTVFINKNNTVLREDNYFDLISWKNIITHWDALRYSPNTIKFNKRLLAEFNWKYYSDYKTELTNSMWNKIISINWRIPWHNWEELLIVNDQVNWYHYINNDFKVLTYNWFVINNIPVKKNCVIQISDSSKNELWFVNIEINTDRWVQKDRVRKNKLRFM